MRKGECREDEGAASPARSKKMLTRANYRRYPAPRSFLSSIEVAQPRLDSATGFLFRAQTSRIRRTSLARDECGEAVEISGSVDGMIKVARNPRPVRDSVLRG